MSCAGAFPCQTELLHRPQMGPWALWDGCSFGHWGCALAAWSCVVQVTKPGCDSANALELGFLFILFMPEVFCKSITWPRAENW